MSFRTAYGYSVSENGWRMCNRDECDITRIPGLTLVDSAPLRKGAPLTILGAWLFWYDRNVEEIVSPVWGWSQTNDVGNSNHLAGTAVDINAPKYPWGARVMPADRKAKIREGQRLFKGSVFWGEDWNRADQMHHQCAWPEGDPRNEAFANDLRAGYLGIYVPGSSPTPQVLSRTDTYALAVINAGRRRNISRKGICIALSVPFVESGWKMYANSNVPASLNLPHDAVGSDHDSTGLFQQRQAWGPLSSTMNPELSAGLFYDGGNAGQRGLTDFPYDLDSKTPGQWAQAVQVSAFPDRYQQHWDDANALYDRLSTTAPQGDDMANVPQDEWNAVKAAVLRLDGEYSPTRRSPSRSFFATDQAWGETPLGFEWNMDGSIRNQDVTWAYLFGVAQAEELVETVANTGVAPASWAGQLTDAQGHWLAEWGQQWCLGLIGLRAAMQKAFKSAGVQTVSAPQTVERVVYRDAPTAAPPAANGSEGQIIGAAYDALAALPSLSDTGKALLTALTGVLQQEGVTK